MGRKDDIMKNKSGYYDPTAGKAILNVESERVRFEKYLDLIFAISELSGFHIEERIVVKDKKTGKIWR